MATREERVSRAEKKVEAIARMKLLGIYPETIKQFEKEDLMSISEPPFGAYFWAEGEEPERIREFETKNNALVYTAIHSYHHLPYQTGKTKMTSYLFVSDYKDEEWEMDRNDLKHGQSLVWVHNHDDEVCSEFGSIGIELGAAAGLVRTW